MQDPNYNTRTTRDRAGASWGWIVGVVIVLGLLVALAFNWNRGSLNTAGGPNGTSPPAATTGSAGGSNVPPATTPAR